MPSTITARMPKAEPFLSIADAKEKDYTLRAGSAIKAVGKAGGLAVEIRPAAPGLQVASGAIRLNWPGTDAAARSTQGNILLTVLSPEVVVKHEAFDDRLKETIILNAYPGRNWFACQLASDFQLELRKGGRSGSFVSEGEPVADLLPVIARDAEGREVAGWYKVEGDGLITVVPDDWLQAAAYPVAIDPTIVTGTAYFDTGQRHRTRKIGGVMSDGTLWVLPYRDGYATYLYVSTDGGETWAPTLPMGYAANMSYACEQVGNKVHVMRVSYDGDVTYECRYYLWTYTPATKTFAQTRTTSILSGTTTLSLGDIGVFANGRVLVSFDRATYQRVYYSDNDGDSFSYAGNVSTTSEYQVMMFARSGTEIVMVVINRTTPVAYLWSNTATGWPTAVTGTSSGATLSTGCQHACIDSATGHIYLYQHDRAATPALRMVVFSGTANTWGSWSAISGITVPTGTTSRMYLSAKCDNGVRRLVYSRSTDSAGAYDLEMLENETNHQVLLTHSAKIVATGFIPSVAPAGSALHVMYGSTAGAYTEIISFNSNPTAPTGLTRAGFDASAAARFAWTFNDPDIGDTQSKFKLRVREVGTATWYYATAAGSLSATEGWVATANEYWDMSACQLTNETDYEWQVMTADAAGAESPYSAQATFSTSSAPMTTITSPAADYDTVTTSRVTVQWSYSHAGGLSQAAYRVRLYASAGGVKGVELWDSGEVTSVSARAKTVEYDLTNLTQYQVEVLVKSSAGVWSA